MTAVLDLVQRVRSNINESAGTLDPLRTDDEVARWLNDGQYDYVSKIPADAVPEIIEEETATGTSWTRPSNFLKLLNIIVSHTLSSTSATAEEEASILSVDESYLTLYYPGGLGAWAQFQKDVIAFGPNAYSAMIRYLRLPSDISDVCADFELDPEHEEPVVNYASAKALTKINDVDAATFMQLYNDRVAAEAQKYYMPLKVEKTRTRVEP